VITTTEIRIDPLLRCPCGRVLKAYDVDVTDTWTRLDCSRCHRRLIEIETVSGEKPAA
jgi:hypothetical protein